MPRGFERAPVLATLLLLLSYRTQALFGWGDDSEYDAATRPITAYNTVTVRTAYALQFLRGSFGNVSAVRTDTMAMRSGLTVTMYQALPSEVVLVFSHSSLTTDTWANSFRPVPYLKPFVYTSEAPSSLLDVWEPLNTGNTTAGPLADAVDAFIADDQLLRMVCIGDGAAGGLAVLCGPWAALQYPEANVDVVTFATPWTGFNPQFAWSFEQLVVLHYMWPFAAPTVAEGGVLPAAKAVNPLITKDNLPSSVRLPNLPAFAPEGMQNADKKSFDEVYSALGPDPTLGEEYMLPPSDCPVMICKTRPLLKSSCLGFDNETIFEGLPYRVLTDDRTDADAIVAWDDDTKTAHFLWKYTEESRDWFTDANGIQREGFIEDSENVQSNGVDTNEDDSLTSLTGEVEVHSGFFNQFRSLAISPDRDEDNILLQLFDISQGQVPRRVTCSGFSLGGALSELCGVWAAIQWPGVDVLVTNQGGPIPGNEEFKLAFEATVGRAYKYSYRMDLVPSTAPFGWYKRVPATIWINGTQALLQDRPDWGIGDLSWDDHTCDVWTNPKEGYTIVGYVPRLYNVTRPVVPKWVYNATSADSATSPAPARLLLLVAAWAPVLAGLFLLL